MKVWVSLFTIGTILRFGAVAHARDVPVATAAALREAIATAMPGDRILVADGTYALTDLSCITAGTVAAPIIVRAVTSLGAKLEFSGVEGFKVSGAHWQFDGLDIRGVCAVDDTCEHAFHVVGNADGLIKLNQVRSRANLPATTLSQASVWKERRTELAMEQDRFLDLVRQGRAGWDGRRR